MGELLIDVRPSMQTGMAMLLLCAMLVIIRSLLKKSGDTTSAIDLDDLILDFAPDGQKHVSIIRCLALAAFALTAWEMVYLTMAGKMTEGYFGLFGTLWVAPLTAAIIWGKKPPFPPAGPTTTIKADNVNVENPR